MALLEKSPQLVLVRVVANVNAERDIYTQRLGSRRPAMHK